MRAYPAAAPLNPPSGRGDNGDGVETFEDEVTRGHRWSPGLRADRWFQGRHDGVVICLIEEDQRDEVFVRGIGLRRQDAVTPGRPPTAGPVLEEITDVDRER